MRAKWAVAAIVVLLVAVAIGALSRLLHPAPVSPAVPVVRPEPSKDVNLSGRILAQHVVSVAPQISGQIDAFMADVGQEVTEGQVLARLSSQALESARDSAAAEQASAQARVSKIESEISAARLESSRARADLSRARSGFDRAQRTYERQKVLNDAGATPRLTYEKSEKDFQLAEGDLKGSEALARQADERAAELMQELENARKILDDKSHQLEDAQRGALAAEVHSPVNGLVIARQGDVGRQQEQGAEMFQIATDLAALLVDVEPDPGALARLKAGQPAMVFVAESPDAIPGQVVQVEGGHVRVAFTSPNPQVRAGMTAQVRIRTE